MHNGPPAFRGRPPSSKFCSTNLSDLECVVLHSGTEEKVNVSIRSNAHNFYNPVLFVKSLWPSLVSLSRARFLTTIKPDWADCGKCGNFKSLRSTTRGPSKNLYLCHWSGDTKIQTVKFWMKETVMQLKLGCGQNCHTIRWNAVSLRSRIPNSVHGLKPWAYLEEWGHGPQSKIFLLHLSIA